MFTLRSKAYDGRYLEVTCQQIPNVEDSTSELRWTLSVLGGAENCYSTGPTTLTIDGQQVYYSKRKSYSTKVFPAARGSVSGSLTVTHGLKGDRSVAVSLTTAIYDTDLATVEDTWQLQPITRASKILAADANIGSCATVVVTRQSPLFSHQISWNFMGLSGWINEAGELVERAVRFRETTLNVLLPERFYGPIANAARGSCRLTCHTYLGEEKIGESSCSFWASADPELCRPVVEGTVVAWDALTRSLTEGKLIPGISTARCLINAQPRNSAYLVSVTAGGVEVVEGEALLEGWSLERVPVVVTDSRGFETRLLLPSPCIPYVQLSLLAEAERPEPTADEAILTLSGSCFCGNFGKAENTLTASVTVNGQTQTLALPMEADSYRVQLPLPGLSYLRSYPVEVRVWDRTMSQSLTVTLRKGLPVFDWGDGDFQFHVPVDLPSLTIAGIPLADYIRTTL